MKHIALAALLFATLPAAQAQQALSLPRADGAQTPVIVYDLPGNTCPPLALISPGAGGNEKGMVYLAEALSRDGWRAIVLGHRESGMDALRGDMRRAHGLVRGLKDLVADPVAYRGRFMDIDAAIAWSEQRCHAPFKALLGHSMGARTVMLEAGAQNKLGLTGRNPFDAYVAMSPPPPDEVFPPDAERTVVAPMLLLTGTRDFTVDHEGYAEREQAFDSLRSTCAWSGVIDGATHLDFAGVGFGSRSATEDATMTLGTSFLDALRDGHCGRPPVVKGVAIRTK
ncbi:MAG TPA: alpha/beta hydrolase [Xanthomonadaceae bacterium]|jgi:predicted dienelactone hydrolase